MRDVRGDSCAWCVMSDEFMIILLLTMMCGRRKEVLVFGVRKQKKNNI